jgi:hypothetical protein
MRYLLALIPILFLSIPVAADPPWEYHRGYEMAPPRERMEEWRERERMEHRLRREYCETHPRDCHGRW